MDNSHRICVDKSEKFFKFLCFAQRITRDRRATLPEAHAWIRSPAPASAPVLFQRDLQSLFFGTRPVEAAQLQPFVKKKKSFQYKSFDAVTAPSAEQKADILFVWIQLKVEFHNKCQSVNAALQIRIAGSNVNILEPDALFNMENPSYPGEQFCRG